MSVSLIRTDDLMQDPSYGFGGSQLAYDGPDSGEVIPEFLEEGRIGEKIYDIPYMRSTEAVYINKTFVEKLGYEVPDTLTWDFIWEVSEAATAKDDSGKYTVNGQNVMIPFIYKSTDNMMIQMLKQKGAGYSTDEGGIEIFNDTTDEILYTVADHVKTGAFSTFKISSYPANFMNAGQCVFAIDSTAGSTWMGTDAPLSDIAKDKLVEFETAVRPVPQFDPDHPQMISQGPSVCIFNKRDPQEVLASWLFAQYLLTNEVQIAYAETEGYVPQVKIDATQMLIDNISNTFTTPVFNGSASLRDAASQLIESVAKSVRRKETIDDAYLQKLYANTISLYRLDQLGSGDAIGGGKQDLGELPATSKALLGILAVTWLLIAVYFIRDRMINKQKNG